MYIIKRDLRPIWIKIPTQGRAALKFITCKAAAVISVFYINELVRAALRINNGLGHPKNLIAINRCSKIAIIVGLENVVEIKIQPVGPDVIQVGLTTIYGIPDRRRQRAAEGNTLDEILDERARRCP